MLVSLLVFIAVVLCSFVDEEAPAIEIIGNKLFDSSTGNQFFIKGIAYQRARKEGEQYDRAAELGYVDSMANPSLCLKDLEYFQELGINTVRVYQIDPTQNHDICMQAFAKYGIYVLLDLSEPELAINRDLPAWDSDLMERYTAVVDNMHSYSNLLGFFAGNEVSTSKHNTEASAYVKAAIRDVKAYIQAQNYRKIPVGYASNDDADTRTDLANYFVCNDHQTQNATADFYAINMFEWCGYSSYATSGYRERTVEFSQLSVPVFFSEFGCNSVTPRPFTEIELLFGPTMSKVWSGGIAYEFLQNVNGYGLVEEDADGKLTKLDDFNVVKLRLIENAPRGVHKGKLSWGASEKHCPPLSPTWKSLPLLPPTPDSGKCECLQATLSCVVTPYAHVHEHNLLQEVCSKTDCLAISGNSSTGTYGIFGACGLRQKISYALNKYWMENGRSPEACNFDGRAVLVTNTGKLELDSLFASDGRTCKEALGEVVETSISTNATWTSSTPAQKGEEKAPSVISGAGTTSWDVLAVTVLVLLLLSQFR